MLNAGLCVSYVADTGAGLTARLEILGRAGITVSICCGPTEASPCRWSVLVRSRDGQEFTLPFAATDLVHAIEIAELEIEKRGWREC